ncbi:MAG: CU044_2847 family protein [Sciscionella sp.]
MTRPVVSYAVDDETVVRFEIEPSADFRPAGADEVAGRIREAVAPAVEGARAVLERVKQAGPDEIVVKFGIKVSGTANWLVARAATEGNFEVTLTWKPTSTPTPPSGVVSQGQ